MWWWLAVSILGRIVVSTSFSVDLRKISCPICHMGVEATPNVAFSGHQHLFACFMAGHTEQIQNALPRNLRRGNPVDVVPLPYNSKDMSCPVCHMALPGNAIEIEVLPLFSKQKLFTCSEPCANKLLTTPLNYVLAASKDDSNSFCTGESAMFDGFKSSFHGTCSMILIQAFVLKDFIMYLFGLFVVFIMAMILEGWGDVREKVHFNLMASFGYISRPEHPRYGKGMTSCYSSHYINDEVILPLSLPLHDTHPKKGIIVRRLPKWCIVFLCILYMIHIALAYFLMLIVMSYEIGLFIAIVLGLGLGFFLFKDTEGIKMSGNIDPCCST